MGDSSLIFCIGNECSGGERRQSTNTLVNRVDGKERSTRWLPLAYLPGASYLPSLAVHSLEDDGGGRDVILACGGIPYGGYIESPGTVSQLCHQLDMSVNQWEQLPSLVTGRAYHSLVSLRGNLYAIGGVNPGNKRASVTVELLEAEHTRGGGRGQVRKWCQLADELPTPLTRARAVSVEQRYLVCFDPITLLEGGGTRGRLARVDVETSRVEEVGMEALDRVAHPYLGCLLNQRYCLTSTALLEGCGAAAGEVSGADKLDVLSQSASPYTGDICVLGETSAALSLYVHRVMADGRYGAVEEVPLPDGQRFGSSVIVI